MFSSVSRSVCLTLCLAALSGCNPFSSLFDSGDDSITESYRFRCRLGTVPCGDGCMPKNSVCCVDPEDNDSSYCTNAAGDGCWVITPEYEALRKNIVVPAGSTSSKFICHDPTQAEITDKVLGSFSCGKGKHACGNACYDEDVLCCPKNKSDKDCPTYMPSIGACDSKGGVLCGGCLATRMCKLCSYGSSCSFDPCTPDSGSCVTYHGDDPPGKPETGTNNTGSDNGGQCATSNDCSAFAARNCSGSANARCASDSLCHCCQVFCTGQNDCRCISCGEGNCTTDSYCVENMCVFKAGGLTTD